VARLVSGRHIPAPWTGSVIRGGSPRIGGPPLLRATRGAPRCTSRSRRSAPAIAPAPRFGVAFGDHLCSAASTSLLNQRAHVLLILTGRGNSPRCIIR